MTSCLIIELQCFPPVEFFAKYLTFQQCYFEKWENYVKRSYRNRYYLLSPQGVHALTIPLKKGKNTGVPIDEVEISYDENWPKSHWRSLQSFYGKSAFFDEFAGPLQTLLFEEKVRLWDFNKAALRICMNGLGLSQQMEFTSAYRKTYAGEECEDLRHTILPPPKEPYNVELLPYPQVFSEELPFQPNLSILDLLFCMGPEALSYLE